MNQQEPMDSACPAPKASDILFWQETGLASPAEPLERHPDTANERELMSRRAEQILLKTRLWWGMR